MIAGIFHQGSGLGNQLFRYVTTRVLAKDKGYEWAMFNNKDFKGMSFMDVELRDFPIGFDHYVGMDVWEEKKIIENGVDIRSYDPEINFVEDNHSIDGEFQDERYWGHRLNEIREWLKVEPLDMPDNVCIIGFRGGEYALYPDLFLSEEWWNKACLKMYEKYPGITFKVVTDDPVTARKFFPHYEITHEIGMDWRQMRYAKHLIIANSSFYILPSLLNEDVKEIFAPRYWARHNTKVWALPQNFYKEFTYV